MDEKPNYYAIIPSKVRYDRNLKDKSKLLYGEIVALSSKEGKCWASNEYFASLYGTTTGTISKLIGELVDRGYINRTIVYKEGSKEISGRYLQIEPYLWSNLTIPMVEKDKDNNTSNNNINNNSIVDEYEKEIGLLTPYQYDKLIAYTVDLKPEMIIEAIHRASSMGKRNLAYIEGILKNWIQCGYKTLGDIKEKSKKPIKEIKKFENDIKSSNLADLYDN